MKAVGVLLSLVGLLIVLLGFWYAVEAYRFVAGSEAASGIIVEHRFTGGLISNRRELGSGHQTQVVDMYAPVVSFTGPDGNEVRFEANWSEGEPPPIGTEVGVRFPRTDPQAARIAGLASLYGGAGILLLLGGIFLGAGWLVIRHRSQGHGQR